MKDIIVDLYNIQISDYFIENVIQNNSYNQQIIEYYKRLEKEYTKYSYDFYTIEDDDLSTDIFRLNEDKMYNFQSKIDSINNCNKLWQMDRYELQKIKDFKKTNLCKDKFCNNCKKVKQASRMSQFIPHLQELEKDFDLFHVVLTVPNVQGHNVKDLRDTIKLMFDSYRKLNHYLQHTKKIKDLDFYEFGYVGSLRSLEVSFNNDTYHPHLHCIFIMKKGLKFNKKYLNQYSYDKFKKKKLRKFSYFELLLQKIWYLLNNKKRVTKKSIEDLEVGYSCMVDEIQEEHYFEVFKYMTKSNNEKNEFLSYDNFKVLYFGLRSVRQIQGFGILYRLKEIDNENEVEEKYNDIISYLQKNESPYEVFETPTDVLKDNEFLVISRKKIYSYLKTL